MDKILFISEGKYWTLQLWKNIIFEIVCGNDFVLKTGRLAHIPLAAATPEQITDETVLGQMMSVCFWWCFYSLV